MTTLTSRMSLQDAFSQIYSQNQSKSQDSTSELITRQSLEEVVDSLEENVGNPYFMSFDDMAELSLSIEAQKASSTGSSIATLKSSAQDSYASMPNLFETSSTSSSDNGYTSLSEFDSNQSQLNLYV